MNSEDSKTSESYVLIYKVTDKLDLRISEKTIALSSLSIYYTWKNIKTSYNNNKLKHQLQHGIINLNYQMERILYQIYVKKVENKVIFKIKTGYSLELLTPETTKLFGSTEDKITKDKNGENVPILKLQK